ncbi:transmembrane protein 54a [Betta splendens]|uniref:Transmembrane protein 54a n=1 Tax=Betta splendens TaxID=158456 RepID=A0A6P7LKG5_BETSP|nr:transmembrane protein 54a [Betta splendens]
MVYCGVCCASLKDSKALMKMGLGLVLVSHVNFLLGALAHGALLRNMSAKTEPNGVEYGISNVLAIAAGLVGIFGGIVAIVLSKNKKSRILQWVLLVFCFLAGLLAAASTVGLLVSVVKVMSNKEKNLINCHASVTGVVSSNITYECPYDPTRAYTTTIILWVLLISMSIVEMVFSFHCFAACTSFLYLCPCRKRPTPSRRVCIRDSIEVATSVQRPGSDSEAEPAEQEDLLDHPSPQEQSHWL